MSFDFSGQVAIVTGAGSGIGFAAAVGLAASGAKVVAIDVAAGEEAAEAIRAHSGEGTAITMDVRDPAAWKRAAEVTIARYGTIDILVNSAGIAVPGDSPAGAGRFATSRRLLPISGCATLLLIALRKALSSPSPGRLVCNMLRTIFRSIRYHRVQQ
jgi:NAD(P)-dependent dehydrogenase (short-subunit alcohol dehydrogenase family)